MTHSIDPRLTSICDCLYRVSAKAIIIQHEAVLLVHEEEGWYGLPGGGIDYEEDITSALQRELSEEIGITASDIIIEKPVVFVSNHEIHKGIPRIQLYYRAHLTDASNLRTNELEFRWTTKQELSTLALNSATMETKDFLVSLL